MSQKMNSVILILRGFRVSELSQIGLTPHSSDFRTQEEHDKHHQQMADEYAVAIDILSKPAPAQPGKLNK